MRHKHQTNRYAEKKNKHDLTESAEIDTYCLMQPSSVLP